MHRSQRSMRYVATDRPFDPTGIHSLVAFLAKVLMNEKDDPIITSQAIERKV